MLSISRKVESRIGWLSEKGSDEDQEPVKDLAAILFSAVTRPSALLC
jgi:hypothetical protein